MEKKGKKSVLAIVQEVLAKKAKEEKQRQKLVRNDSKAVILFARDDKVAAIVANYICESGKTYHLDKQ